MLPETVYINCDLPSDVRRLEDPELFFRGQPEAATIVLDEIHRLADPSRVLKIAADAFPKLRILATGSSTLAATRKFRDTLTGRKRVLQAAYPSGRNYLVCPGIRKAYERRFRGLVVRVAGTGELLV